MFESLEIIREICRCLGGTHFEIDYNECEDNFSFRMYDFATPKLEIYYKRVYEGTPLVDYVLDDLKERFENNHFYANLINQLSIKHPKLLREYLENA